MRGSWLLGVCGVVLGCAPELRDIKDSKETVKAPEQHEIYPVGGYQILAGSWRTTRRDEVLGEQVVPLLFSVEKDVIEASDPDSAVRFRCQLSHRSCLGRWYDNVGTGRFSLTFATDFQSFTGTYDGTSQGRDVGRSSWTGTR